MRTALSTAWRMLDNWLEGPASLIAERWHAGRAGAGVQAHMAEDGRTVYLRASRKAVASEVPVSLGPADAAQQHIALLSPLVRGRRVELSAARAWVIERRIELPLEAGGHLDGIVASRIAALSPLPVQDTLYGHRVAGSDDAAKRIGVDIVLLPKVRVARALDLIEAAGARHTEVVAHTAQGTPITLYPRRAGRHATLGRVKFLLGFVLVVSVLAALAAAGANAIQSMQQSALRAGLEARAAAARATISEVMAPQTAGTAPEQAAIEIKNEAVSVLGALDDLAEALPAHSFATEITLMNGRLRLAGRTYDLPEVLTALESSGRFVDSALVGPTVRGEDERSSLFMLETRPLIRTGGNLQ